ncbi:hypothetical protein [Pseudomonas amygdali]|uniref:hypothetical protein n=1 Tax=Pseudomonas amygdali TaxID=47877 RepID=UPI000F407D37|nr:hypothetical protein [Pseudomonas amygdali]RMV89907.1 hypothetical protein ALP04_200110 [Pseudomonas amygdali pv. sesami]
MSWTDITDNGRVYSMAHLQPFTHVYKVDERDITVHFTFGFHCFTDEKDDGKLISNHGERRSFSPTRWEASKELGPWIRNRLLDARVTLYHDHKRQRRYFCMDLYDYALFFQITKPESTVDTLKILVISAYGVDQWGRSGLPHKGPHHNLSWVLSQRAQGIIL